MAETDTGNQVADDADLSEVVDDAAPTDTAAPDSGTDANTVDDVFDDSGAGDDVARGPACDTESATCADNEVCVNDETGYCGVFSGFCEPRSVDCAPDASAWRACPCEGLPAATLCELRGFSGRQAGVCIDSEEGVACNPSSTIGCGDGVCVPRACEGGSCGGVCLTLADACADSPALRVCAGELWLSGDPLEPLGECWPSACEAWTAGHRGTLVFAD